MHKVRRYHLQVYFKRVDVYCIIKRKLTQEIISVQNVNCDVSKMQVT